MADQHGFTVTIEVIEAGDYATAFRQAIATADAIFNEMSNEAEVVVRETGQSVFQGIPNGVYCEGCVGHVIPGVRWPTATNGDDTREWVERCDMCERYTTDEEAADRVVAEYTMTDGPTVDRGHAIPEGKETEQPYVEVTA